MKIQIRCVSVSAAGSSLRSLNLASSKISYF